jgi:hypothetical protein
VKRLVVAVAACSALASQPAAASDTTFSAAVLGGYGLELDTFQGDRLDAYHVGLGARVGVTFAAPRVYVGVAYTHHFGTSASAVGPGSSFEQRHRDSLLGLELGYDLALGRSFTLRPFVSAGALFASRFTSVSDQAIDESATRFYIAPGALLAYRVGPLFFGPELRMTIAPSQPAIRWAPSAMAAVGVAY